MAASPKQDRHVREGELMTPIFIDEELRRAGLATQGQIPSLTPKGREWLRAMEDLETEEVAAGGEAAADLILSTNALIR